MEWLNKLDAEKRTLDLVCACAGRPMYDVGQLADAARGV